MKASFVKFLWYIWIKVLLLPVPTRLQYDIANFLAKGPRKRVIHAFRGVGKSFITAAYIVWRLWKDPDLKIMVVSANELFAQEISTFIKLIISSVPFLEHLQARNGQRDSNLIFDVGAAKPDKSPSVKAVGITGQLTGSRADIILFDDVEVPKNSETETMREKLDAKTQEAAAVLKPGGEIIYLGTPQTEESIYRKLPEKGYSVRIWPGRYPLKSNMEHYGDLLAPMLRKDIEDNPRLAEACYGSSVAGAPTDPYRFDEMDLVEREAEYSKSGFMLQFMLDTRMADADRYPLKLKDLVVMDLDKDVAPVQLTWASGPDQMIKELPNVGFEGDRYYRPMYVSKDFVPYTGAMMYIDPSGRGSDETGYAVVKFLNGTLFATRLGGLRGGYDEETLNALCLIAKDEGVNEVQVEANFGDGMYLKLLAPVLQKVYPCTLTERRVTGQKERRVIDTLEPVLQQHRLVINTKEISEDYNDTNANAYRLFYQLTHITNDRGSLKHDDRIDALEGAVAYWIDHMDQDVKAGEERRRKELEDQDLEDFLKHVTGTSVNQNISYISRR